MFTCLLVCILVQLEFEYALVSKYVDSVINCYFRITRKSNAVTSATKFPNETDVTETNKRG